MLHGSLSRAEDFGLVRLETNFLDGWNVNKPFFVNSVISFLMLDAKSEFLQF